MDTDPLAEAAEVRRQMLAAFRRVSKLGKIIVVGFAVTTVLLIAVLGGIVGITLNTNLAVKDRHVIEDRNVELEKQVDTLQATLDVAVDYVVKLAHQVEALGGDPGEIRIEPPKD